MRIVKASRGETLVGYDYWKQLYLIKRRDGGEEYVPELKVVNPSDRRCVAICKKGGIVENSYATQKRYGNDLSWYAGLTNQICSAFDFRKLES